jgi:hypothetical protein
VTVRHVRFAIAFAALAGMLAACASVPANPNSDVHGADVERSIDAQISPLLRVGLDDAVVKPSRCPERIDLTLHPKQFCELPIEDSRIPITVRASSTMLFAVGLEGTVFRMRRLAGFAANDIAAEYGIRTQVDCGRGLRLLTVGTHVRCTVAGTRAGYAELEFRGRNRILVRPLAGMGRGRLAEAVRPYLLRHAAHRSTVVPGTVIAPYIVLQIRNQFGGKAAWLRPLHGARCPDRADLSGAKRMTCRLQYGDGLPRYAAWIDDAEGVRMEPVDAIMLTAMARTSVLESLKAKLAALGRKELAAVDCGPDRILVQQPGSTFHCRAYAGREQADVTVTVVGTEGDMAFTFAPLQQSS